MIEGRAVIAVDAAPGRVERWIRRVFPGPDVRFATLDDLGTDAWLLADGSRTVRAIAADLRAKHRESAEPAEERAARFATALAGRGWIRLATGPVSTGDDARGFTPERGYRVVSCTKCARARPIKAPPGARYLCPACGKLTRAP